MPLHGFWLNDMKSQYFLIYNYSKVFTIISELFRQPLISYLTKIPLVQILLEKIKETKLISALENSLLSNIGIYVYCSRYLMEQVSEEYN